MNIFERIAQRFAKTRPLPEGMHHYQAPPGDQPPYRLHLRIRPDGSALLVVNASTVLHLNPTAAEYAYHMIKGSQPEEAAQAVASRYRVARKTALQDYHDFLHRVQTLIFTPDLDPVSFLDFERAIPHAAELTAPLRLDCALTYRLPAGTDPMYAPVKNVTRELDTDEWKGVLEKAWLAGVPHITFTGGEPTLREDLPVLIAHAEQIGQVTGLLSDGRKLTDQAYLQVLLQTGLDHLLLILQPDLEQSWKAVETVMPEDLFTTVHITITPSLAGKAEQIISRLAALEVQSLSLSASDPSLSENLSEWRDLAAEHSIALNWDLPVPYSEMNPVALETVEDEIPSGAGKAWLYIEPDGDVLPEQGLTQQVLGNFLTDPWDRFYRQ